MSTTTSGNSPILRRGTTVAHPDRRNVNIGAQLTPTIQRLYSIFLWDLNKSRILTTNPSLDPAGRTLGAEYFFNTPPKVNDMTEPFATRIIATQNGGKYIESNGSIFKEIRVSGTTGLRPRKKAPTVIPLLPTGAFEGLAEAFTDTGFGNQIRTIPSEEITGFDDIHFLRNIFRRYSDSKGSNERVIMVWRNIKDDDYWVVEPRSFKLVQSSQSPLTYSYQLDLQGLSLFDPTSAIVTAVDDPLATLRDVARFFSRIQEFKQNLTSVFLVVATQIRRIQGAGHFLMNNSIGSLTAVIKGLTAISTASTDVSWGLQRAAAQARSDWNKALSDLTAALNTSPSVPYTPIQRTHLQNFGVLINASRRVLRVLDAIQSEPSLQDNISTGEESTRARIREQYRTPGGGTGSPTSPRSAGDPTFIGNSGSPTNIGEDRVHVGESIRDLSKRLLGDFRRWHELVLLNDLRAPYTSDGTPSPGVLVPGDVILFPSNIGTVNPVSITPAMLTDAETENKDTNASGIISQTYGRDLRLKSVSTGNSTDLTDLCVNQRGDLSTIVGIPNVKQAILIKFSTEQGELASHPGFGARFPIGSKADVVSFNEFRISTLATLKSDSRITSVARLEFRAVADTLQVSADLVLQDGSEFLNTDFALRRF